MVSRDMEPASLSMVTSCMKAFLLTEIVRGTNGKSNFRRGGPVVLPSDAACLRMVRRAVKSSRLRLLGIAGSRRLS